MNTRRAENVRFVDEPIEPVAGTYDTERMAVGEPGLPGEFLWRGRKVVVESVVKSWRETGPCRHGSGEQYVRKHWYEVLTTEGEVMRLYFDRQARRGQPTGQRWWLFSVRGAEKV